MRHVARHKSNLVSAFHGDFVNGSDHLVSTHSDANLFTLIYYWNGPDGLEIYDRYCKRWVRVNSTQITAGQSGEVPPLLLNIGDEMVWLSNGRFPSTPHRVARVEHDEASASWHSRLALIFFYAAGVDALLSPYLASGEEAKLSPMLAGRHTYNYRTAGVKERDAFDAWARAQGLLKDSTSEKPRHLRSLSKTEL